MKNKRLLIIVLMAGTLLLIPWIIMQFNNEAVWSAFDFLVAGVLFFGTGLTIELVLRKTSSLKNRIILCGVLLALLFLVWAELAVGIFGTPLAGS